MEGRVYSEILRRVEGRREANVIPEHTTLLGLRRWAYSVGIPEETLLRSLSGLRRQGRVLVGRTLNDWWIKPAESESAK